MATVTAAAIRKTLLDLADPNIAEHSQRFFKTGKGEYGEGDRFLGIRVPVLRKHVARFNGATRSEVQKLLKSPFHEERLFALLLLVHQYGKGTHEDRSSIYSLYLSNTQYINNWDLVDSSAYQIVGTHVQSGERDVLYELVRSDSLWERRIAMMATYQFIRNNDFRDTLKLSEQLLDDEEDLIHKVVGWMLREIGKRDIKVEKRFLRSHYKTMPRTMLRYAIEKFPEGERSQYLMGEI